MKGHLLRKLKKEAWTVAIVNLIKSQGEYLGMELPEDDDEKDINSNGAIMEAGNILWFNNVQLMEEGDQIIAPTFLRHSAEMALFNIPAEKKKWNVTKLLPKSDVMIVNGCICSKTNKYKCSCFRDRKP